MTDEHQKWLRHISHGCVRAYIYKPTDENYNGYIAWLFENDYLTRKKGQWALSEKGEAHLTRLKELLP